MIDYIYICKHMCYSIVCAWCNKTIGINGTDEERMNGAISHGICEACKAKMEVL